MNLKNFNLEKTCSVTGHRVIKNDINISVLREVFIKLINDGKDTFLIGMAVGFDTVCFKILQELKEYYNIKLVACIPCLDQDKSFTCSQREVYKKILNDADEKVLVSENYTPYCMHKRNAYMIDNSDTLVAYLREEKGGTFNTVKYAKSKNKKIIYI